LAARGARTPDEGGARTVGVTTGSRGLPGIGHLGCAAAWAETAAAVAGGPDGRAVRLELGGGGRYTIRFDFAPGWRPHPGSGGPDGRPDAPPPPPTPDTADFTPYTSAPQAWRDSREELRLIGARCPRCEAPQYPAAPACPVHGLGAETVPHEMALTGRVLTRTRDHVFPVGGPLTTAVVELADGGRFYGQVAAGHDVAIGDAVELVLRRIATAQGTAPRYFWKILPTTEGGR
ncbi:MAG TPA: zinc ribbon domain-containing protein, partial [Streptomyces sp.]|nr:zinc ribbon domain-containing protein [Streptomyces sp.]